MREFPHRRIIAQVIVMKSLAKCRPREQEQRLPDLIFVALVRSGLVVMFIHEMTFEESSSALGKRDSAGWAGACIRAVGSVQGAVVTGSIMIVKNR